MVSFGSLPRFRWGRSARVELSIGGGTRVGELDTETDAGAIDDGDGYGWEEGSRKSGEEKDQSPFKPTLDKALRSCWPEMRPEPSNKPGWETGALNEECRIGSSYLRLRPESWLGVELGRTIPGDDVDQLSASGNEDRFWVREE